MTDINLIPEELIPRSSLVRLSATLRRIAVIGASALVAVALVLIVYFFVLGRALSGILIDEERLKNEIKALEDVEQSLVLTKDRIKKIQEVMTADKTSSKVKAASSLLAALPFSLAVSEVTIDADEMEMGFVATSADLAEAFAIIASRQDFGSIRLTSFSFSPANGYLVAFRFFD